MIQYLYWMIQIMNYCIFMILDFTGQYADISNSIKFFSIILCFLYVAVKNKGKRSVCISTGLFFTVIADYFLVLKNESLYGVISFCIVQTIYSWWLSNGKERFIRKTCWILGAVLVLLGSVVWIVKVPFEMILVFLCYYFITIISNVVLAIKSTHNGYLMRVFAVGMVLFLCCDMNVAIINLEDFLVNINRGIMDKLVPIALVAIWFFYLPSQLLIAYAGRYIEDKKDGN